MESVGKGQVTRRQEKRKIKNKEDYGKNPDCNEKQRTKVDNGP